MCERSDKEGCVQDGVLLGGSGTLTFLYRLLQPQEFCGTVQPDPLAQVTSLLPEKQQVWVQEVPVRFEGETGLPKTCFLEGFSGSQEAGRERGCGRQAQTQRSDSLYRLFRSPADQAR